MYTRFSVISIILKNHSKYKDSSVSLSLEQYTTIIFL